MKKEVLLIKLRNPLNRFPTELAESRSIASGSLHFPKKGEKTNGPC